MASIPADNPIDNEGDDLLGRGHAARAFAEDVLSLDASEGVVVGVLGAWGSGKTSYVNLARARFAELDVPVLDFNPWMFSGTEQLVASFFIEMSAQLKLRTNLAGVGQDFEEYGEAFSGLGWLPFVGPWIERARGVGKVVSKLLERRKEGIGAHRQKVREATAKLNKPVVVVLDDIDRLTTDEIRDVFKLIRLTANFPNLIYVVAFDRVRVETALSEVNIPGRDYLEKILQLAVDLPAVPEQVLTRQLLESIDVALRDLPNIGPFNDQAWPDVLVEVIRPLVKNMRDVRRYVAAMHGTVRQLNGQIALVDVLALEAVRVFLPDVFEQVRRSVDGLTTASGMNFGGSDPPHLKAQVEGVLASARDHQPAVRSMIQQLFPAAGRHVGGSHYTADWKRTWLKERRVAHTDLLTLYLERIAGEGLLAFNSAERAWAVFTDAAALNEALRAVPPSDVQDVVASLEAYEADFTADHVVSGLMVLLNLLADVPQRQRGMLDLDTRMVFSRVVYRLLRALPDDASVEAAVGSILPEVPSLSSQLELISSVGHREGRGHKLATEAGAAQFEREWRERVRSAVPAELAKDEELFRVLILTKREAEPGEPDLAIDFSPEMTAALLRSARTETRSQSMGSRAVHREARLHWDALVELYDNETVLGERVAELRTADLPDPEGVVELAERYLGGWRPREF